MTAPTLAATLRHATGLGLERLDAQLLLLHALGRSQAERAWLLAHDQELTPTTAQALFHALVQRRIHGEPVAYLVGYKEFFGLQLQTTAGVLVPRPDTETLVEWALQVPVPPTAAVIDLGSGSGAIALALKHQRPHWEVTGTDISAPALQVAQSNGKALGLVVHWVQAAWLQGLSQRFDLIVSNPPYIREHDPHLADLRFEPSLALTSGPDGLDDLRQIVATAPKHLQPGGWLLLEHGYDQGQAVCALLSRHGFAAVQSRQDLGGNTRCSGGQWQSAR